VHDNPVLKLIRRYLEAGVMADGVRQPGEEGTPQGSTLSPLLSTVMLDDLDANRSTSRDEPLHPVATAASRRLHFDRLPSAATKQRLPDGRLR